MTHTHHTQRPVIEPNRVYSREEVAEVLNISLSTVKRLIASRRLRVSQPPGMRRVLILGQHVLDLLHSTEITSDMHDEADMPDETSDDNSADLDP